MAKLNLAPADIIALLKTNPELELELNNKALSQIADLIIRKVTKESVEKRVSNLMEMMVTEQVGWNKGTLAPKLQKMIEDSIAEACRQSWQNTLAKQIRLDIATEATSQMRATAHKLVENMKTEIRNVVREELRALLGKV